MKRKDMIENLVNDMTRQFDLTKIYAMAKAYYRVKLEKYPDEALKTLIDMNYVE